MHLNKRNNAVPEIDGLLRCSRYAFGPNKLHYCGPDKNQEILSYIQEDASDLGLKHLLSQFQTLYPYLRHIAEVNHIQNPFDNRVVEAYWLGNKLLNRINKLKFYRHLIEDHQLKKKVGQKGFELIEEKLRAGALPCHSFHVLDIWRRSGNLEKEHTLETMDQCRISWGKILNVSGPFITIETELLEYSDGKLFLGKPIKKQLVRRLESDYDIEQLKFGDYVSIHWGVICEKLTVKQLANLQKYTLLHLKLAN